MYKIIWNSDNATETFKSESAWETRIEEIAEDTFFDIDVTGNVATIDDGDFDIDDIAWEMVEEDKAARIEFGYSDLFYGTVY